MALSDGLGIQALVQSYDKKAISQAFTEIASQLNKSVDDLNDDLNKIKIDKDVVNNLVNQLKALPEEIRKKTQGMSFDLFSDLINADGAEEKIDKAIETFSNKMKSFVKLRDSIGNDKIIIETDLSDLDELIKKEEKILSLETQIQGLRQQTKKYRTGNDQIKSIEDEINAWVQNRQQVDKYNVEIDEVKKNITELAKSNRNINWSNIDNKNVDTIKEMVGWLERYVQLTGDISGLKELNIPGVIDLRKLFSGDITSVDPNLTQQVKDFQDIVKRYSGNFNTDVNIQSSGSIDTQKLKEQEQEINKIRESLTKTESQLEQVNQKYAEQSDLVSELENKLKALEGISNPKVIETDKYKNIISELETAKNKASEFQAELDETKQTVEVLKNSLSSYNTEDVVPRQDFENANSIIDNLSSKIKELETSLTETESKFTFLSSEVTTLQQDKSDLSGQLSQQKEINATQQEQISNSQKIKIELDEIKKKYQDLTNSIKEMEAVQSRYMSLLDKFGQAEAFNEAMQNVDYNEGKNTPEGFVNFDYLDKAKQKLQETGNAYEKATKAAVYYYQYLQKGGTEKILNKDGKDISDELISLYKEMSSLADDKTGQISYESLNKTVREYANELRLAREEQSREKELINQKNKELKETLYLEKNITKTKQESQKAEEQTKNTTAKSSSKRTMSRKEVAFTTARQKEQQVNQGDSSNISQPLQQDSSSILSEQQALEKLEQAINSVTIAIAQKNKAIQAEEVQMDKSVNSEIAKLEELKGKLNEIKTQFEQGIESGFFKNINSEDVDGNFVNIDLKPTVDANKFKEDAERLLTLVDVEKEVNLKVGELDTSNITDTTSTVISPVSENIANDNVIEEQNKDLELQQIIYNNIIKLLTEYLSLQDRINAGNKDIANGDLISFNDIRKQTGKVSQRAVKDQLNNYLNISKNENGIYNDDSIKRAKEQLAAYVANFNNAEKAAEIFGNKNKELFNEICQMIDNAKVSLDAYNNAQDSIDVAESRLSELNKLQTGENLTYGQLWDLEKIVKTDGLESGLKYITDELGIKIPEAAQKAESAIAEVNNELSKPQQKTPSVEGQTGNDQDGKKSDVITVPVEPLLVQKEWEDKIDDILKAIGTKKISIIPDTTSDEWNEFKTFINKISNLTINLNNVTDPKSIAESDLNDSYKRSINAATELYAVEEKIAQAKESNNQQELKKLSTLEAQKKKFEELLKLEEKFRANERFSDIDTSTNDNELKQLRESLEQKYQNNRQTNATNLASNMDNLYDEAAGEYSKKLLQDQLFLQKEIESTKTRIAKLEKDSITSDENELSKNQSEQESLKQKITLLEQSSNQLQNEINQFDQYIDKQQQAVALEEIRIKAEKDRAKLTKNSVDDSNNYARVNNLLKEQEETIRRINVLQTKQDEIGLTDIEQKLLNSLSEKFLSIQEQVTAELNKQYDLTARIADRREKLASNNKLGLNDIGSLDFSGDTNYNASVENINKVVNTIDEAQRKLQSLNNPNANSIYQNEYQKAAQDVQDLTNELLNSQNAASNLNKYVKETDSTINRLSSKQNVIGTFTPGNINAATEAIKRYIQTIDGIDQSTIKWNTNGTRLTATFKDIDGQLRNLIIQANVAEGQFSQTFGSPVKQATTLSKFLDELGVKFRNLSTYLLSFVGFYEVWGAIQQGVTYVRELDSALTEMKKVSDETTESLKAFQEESFDIADSVASTAKEIQNSTADWLRLGYAMDEASELARTTAVYKAVGDDMDIATATESMVSTLQGFQLEADQAANIVDQFNEVSNNFAIDSKGIGDALQRSAASFNAANTGMSEAIALITATNAVLQDPEKVGNMWRTVSARIRGAKQELIEMGEDTDGMVESTSKLRDQIKALTGFDIMEDENTYKNIMDIIIGIGDAWEDLTDLERAGLLESLAGKQQSNALAAALQNVDMIREVYETAQNADGSAQEELESQLESIEGRIARLTNQIQEFWYTFIDTGVVKGAVDFLTTLVSLATELVDTLGSVPTVIGAITAGLSIKGALTGNGGGRAKNKVKNFMFVILRKLITHRRFNLSYRKLKIA